MKNSKQDKNSVDKEAPPLSNKTRDSVSMWAGELCRHYWSLKPYTGQSIHCHFEIWDSVKMRYLPTDYQSQKTKGKRDLISEYRRTANTLLSNVVTMYENIKYFKMEMCMDTHFTSKLMGEALLTNHV